MVWTRQEDIKGENTKISYGIDTRGEKKKRTSKKNVDGRSTSNHDNKKFITRSVEKQGGMAFGFCYIPYRCSICAASLILQISTR
jgi:hypothetical protein